MEMPGLSATDEAAEGPGATRATDGQQKITENNEKQQKNKKQPRSGWAEGRATDEAAEGPGATGATDGQQKITENHKGGYAQV